jgi:hypothetical protein
MTALAASSPMIKLKAKPQQEAAQAASLADRIRAAQAEAEVFVQKKVDELKASDEGKQLPRR